LTGDGPHGLQLAYVGAGRIDVFHQLLIAGKFKKQ